jgi:hypothetical protein
LGETGFFDLAFSPVQSILPLLTKTTTPTHTAAVMAAITGRTMAKKAALLSMIWLQGFLFDF